MNKIVGFVVIAAFSVYVGWYLRGNNNLLILTNEQNRSASNSVAGINRGNCVADDCLVTDVEYPAGTLPKEVVDALGKAIDDEFKAFATYDAVIKKVGNVRPFVMIIGAEEQHIAQLRALFVKYGLVPKDNEYIGKIDVSPTLTNNCNTGVAAEIANVALYRDELLPKVADYADITQVFNSLMNASQEKHLPAFQRCSANY